MAPLFVMRFTLLVMFASSTSGDKHFCVIFTLCRPPPHEDWGRAGAAGNRLALDDKGYMRKKRRRYEPSAQRRRKQTACAISAHAQCACLLSLQTGV